MLLFLGSAQRDEQMDFFGKTDSAASEIQVQSAETWALSDKPVALDLLWQIVQTPVL